MAFGWKVCSNVWGSVYSLYAGGNRCLPYKYGEFVMPLFRDEPLAVFSTYDEAKKMSDISESEERIPSILPCEYIPSDLTPYWAKDKLIDGILPQGTVFADAVRIF